MRTVRVLLLAMLLCVAGQASAYDFAVRISSGDTLFFDIINRLTREASVVAPNPEGPDYYAGHQRPSGVMVIPAEVKNIDGRSYQVSSIGDRAFWGSKELRHVVIPQSVRSIGAYAFYGCSGISERLRIPENIRTIGSSAFYGCTQLPEVVFGAVRCTTMGGAVSTTAFGNCGKLRRVVLEEGVESIPDYAFCGVETLRDSVVLPSTLRSIGEYAFAYCGSLQGTLVVPDSVTRIGDCAFHQCHSLRGLVLGASVAYIGGRAFYHCVGIHKVTVRAYRPPTIVLTSFAALVKGAKFAVPCASKQLYESAEFWDKMGPFEGTGSCSFSVVAEPFSAGTCTVEGGGDYRYGDSVCLRAICNAGNGFVGWSDGISDNPRCFVAEDNMTLSAITCPAAIITIHDTLRLVDTVYADGYKVVYDTIERFDIDRTIEEFPELSVNQDHKRLEWDFRKAEPLLSLSLYNQQGDCLYTTTRTRGSVDLQRYGSGTFFLRVQTASRTVRCRFFFFDDPYIY